MALNPSDSPVLGTLFGSDAMRAVFDERAWFQRMLDVEAALARVQARLGIIPAEAASAITRARASVSFGGGCPLGVTTLKVGGSRSASGERTIMRKKSPGGRTRYFAAQSRKARDMSGTSGPGSQSQFVAVQLRKLADVEFTQTPFKGQTDMMVAVAGGHLEIAMMNLPLAVRQRADRRVKILATMTEARHKLTPDVPTLDEAGYPGIRESAWYGFFAPATTDPAQLKALHADVARVLRLPEIAARLEDLGIDPVVSDPDVFAATVREQTARYRAIAKAENIKAE